MIIFQLCTLGLASLVEYRFGRNFGSKFYDYSGNGNHGLNGDGSSPSMVMSTDRGIYLNGGTSIANNTYQYIRICKLEFLVKL